MLHIHNRGNLKVGGVYCLHITGQPEPDLGAEEAPYVKLLFSMDSTSVHGIGSHFYACNRQGRIINRSGTRDVIMPQRLDVADSVNFVPVVQLHWEDVQRLSHGSGYVVYNPDGRLLQRLDARDVHFRRHDGSVEIGDSYIPLCYEPERGGFIQRRRRIDEDPQQILRAFADESGCSVSDLVFVPTI